MSTDEPPRLKIVWRSDLDIKNCYFVISLGTKSLVQFNSPRLRHSRQLTCDEVDRVKKLVQGIAPRIPNQDGIFAVICPEIQSELQISGDGWDFKYRWTNNQVELSPEDFQPLEELGTYIMRILPVQDMGFDFPIKL